MSTTTTSGTRRRTTSESRPFAPGAIIAGKKLVRWNVDPRARGPYTHLDRPLRWRAPRHVDVRLDLFHEALSDEQIAAVFGVMAAARQHTFQILTKRPERMRRWFSTASSWAFPAMACSNCSRVFGATRTPVPEESWPLPNVWLGVSVEDQATADERIPLLLQTPAAVRWVSYEPALERVDFVPWLFVPESFGAPADLIPRNPSTFDPALSWIVVGGESGPGARPFDLAWARSAIAQCRDARVPVFVKQLGAEPGGLWLGRSPVFGEVIPPWAAGRYCLRNRKGGDPSEWPEDLRVRGFPA